MNRTVIKSICLLLVIFLFAPVLSGCEVPAGEAELRLCGIEALDSGTAVYLQNVGKSAADLEGFGIECGEDFSPLSGTLEPGGTYKAVCSFTPEDGDALTLCSPHQQQSADSLTVPWLISGMSYRLSAEGWRYYTCLSDASYASAEEALNDINSPIIINEVMPDGAGDPGWIELHNVSDSAVELSGYSLTPSLTSEGVSLAGRTVEPGGYLLLQMSSGSAAQDILPLSCSGRLFLVCRGRAAYTASWTPTLAPLLSCGMENGKTVYYASPTPGSANGASLESADITDGTDGIEISEILLNNTLSVSSFGGKRTAWAELHNTGDSDISLSGLFLSNDPEDMFRWALPDITLSAGEYILIFFRGRDAQSVLCEAPFTLSGGDSTLYLTNVHALKRQSVPLDNSAPENISQDAAGVPLDRPTPAAPNGSGAAYRQTRLLINEVCSVHPARSREKDWIELYNPTDASVSLEGLYLSDSKKEPFRYKLSGKIPAGGYLVIKTDDISIASEGEKVYLSCEDYIIDIFNTPRLLPQYTAGRSGGAEIYLMPPTPGSANSTDTLKGYCAAPIFSQNGGYYASGLSLSITCPDPQAQIFYTLDGSAPDESDTPYTGPVKIESTSVVRAVALRAGYAPSLETAGTFRTGEDTHSLPVVCLSMDGDDLEYICASESRLDIRERAGYVEYYSASGAQQTAFPAGLSIGGNSTRKYRQKTFNIHLRGAYGQSEVQYPFFENNDGISTYSSLCLRNCGQDAAYTRMRDAFVSMAADGLNVNNAKTGFAVVYLNGKYNGIYEFKENQNEDYLAAHTGCDRDTVQIVRANTYVYNKIGTSADIKSLIAFAAGNDCSDDEVYARYITRIDEDYYTDYLICVAFFMLSDAYNQKSIRSMDGVVKWQPVLYDLDNGMGKNYRIKVLRRFFTDEGIYTPSGFRVETVLFNAFYKNAAWREKFVLRYAELLNSALKTENLLALFDSMTEQLRPEMERNCNKWHTPSDLETWEQNVSDMRTSILNRRKYALQELQSLFGVSDARMRQLFPDDLELLG